MDFEQVRPTHDDFWKLSNLIIEDDLKSEVDKDYLFKTVAEQVDSYSVTYMAMQRAFRALQIMTVSDLRDRQEEAAKNAALWLEGFLIGCQFKDSKGDQ